jgi:hypothetical protein
MSWTIHHSKSEEYASQAEAALKQGDAERAAKLYQSAAEEEETALTELDTSKVRTLGITTISAASLWYKAHNFRQAERVAFQWLATDFLPDFAIDQLQTILQSIWNEKIYRQSGIEFMKGEVLVSVGGGEVVTGGAPLHLILRKVDEVRSFFYRTIEMLLNLPFRRHGSPISDIQEQFRPWLLQAPPGSYQFAVRVQKPAQMSLFREATPEVEEITRKFLKIVEDAAKETHEDLESTVPNPEYRETFLKLSRNLAPTGKSFDRLEIKSATDMEARPIVFSPTSRQAISKTLREIKRPSEEKMQLKEEQVRGVLRALHLDQDWLEVSFPGTDRENIRISQTGNVIDDLVGPMVNHRVIVDVALRPDGKRLFRDIQSEE